MTAVRDWEQWSTSCRLVVTAPEALAAAGAVVDEVLADIDRACSRFRRDSELLTLTTDAEGWSRLSPTLADLMAVALDAARHTDGAVDPTIGATLVDLGYDRDIEELRDGAAVPVRVVRRPTGWRSVVLDGTRMRLARGTQLDLGATAKAVAADWCAEAVADRLGTGVLVSLGGDIATAGPSPEGGWQVTVQDLSTDLPQQITLADGAAVATSSIARRTWLREGVALHHLVDPVTARPATGRWRSVTVVAPTCARANTAATAALVKGDAAVAWLQHTALPARLVSHDGDIATLNQWPKEIAA
ncbi:FAD:protein FMN transferase [Nocardioides pocheonensis]|uniref:FAD:protein FMN transferase n=1 Tax=Nocardioides pocheonensis TaxID=661485 RepID=A0A3N0GVK1_9ACTN|nr:FAD:protein FMN transferase [Nocardioides pocheonensis]RNM16494.1 FAD:protein FMN transferase [Nocardioides pocheonensis]